MALETHLKMSLNNDVIIGGYKTLTRVVYNCQQIYKNMSFRSKKLFLRF